MKDRRGDFYFLTYDADAEKPYLRGFSWRDFQGQLLEDLAPQKILMLVDTCHAGGVSGEERTRGVALQQGELALLADRLNEATGCYIFMASTTREKALESSKWEGGVFAAAILEGLGGEAARKDQIWVLGLLDYVEQRVIELTKGIQHPVWKAPKNGRNFPLALAGE